MKKSLLNLMLIIVSIIIIATFSFVGCKEATEEAAEEVVKEAEEAAEEVIEESEEEEQINLVFLTWAEPARLEAQKVLNEAFTEKYPNITVSIDKPDNYWDKINTMVASGAPLDVFFQQEMMSPTYAELGIQEDLTPYIEGDEEFNTNVIFPAFYEPFTIDGRIFGIPSVAYVSVFFYNKDMFDVAGIEYPDSSWTWDKYRDVAKSLTLDTNNDGTTDQYGHYQSTTINFLYPWMFSNGGELIDDSRTKCVFNSPENIETFTFLTDLIYKDKVSPTPILDTETNIISSGPFSFATGKIAMELTGSWMISTYEAAEMNFGIAVIPMSSTTGEAVPMVYPNGYAMYTGSEHKDAAWKYISFCASEEAQLIMAETKLGMPTHIDVANSPVFLESSKIVDTNIIIESVEIAKGPNTTARWSEVTGDENLGQYTDLMWLNEASVEDTLNNVTIAIDSKLQEINED